MALGVLLRPRSGLGGHDSNVAASVGGDPQACREEGALYTAAAVLGQGGCAAE